MELNIDTLQLDKLSGEDFEKVIGELLKHESFTALKFTRRSFDFGADILAEKDDAEFAVQIKRSMSPVGVTAVQEVLGGMAYYGAAKGLVITNALFSSSAIRLQPSWVHRRPNGQVEFYFSEQDIENAFSVLAR